MFYANPAIRRSPGQSTISNRQSALQGSMHRREFLKTTTAAAILSAVPAYAAQLAESRKRVGLIGTGWYGKTDLFRLIQVAPVDVVSLCDVDTVLLEDAAQQVAARQASLHRVAQDARRRHRAGVHLFNRVHPREPVAAGRTVDHLGSREGRGGRRRGSQQAAATAVSRSVGPSRAVNTDLVVSAWASRFAAAPR
jgi:hypothetical protein